MKAALLYTGARIGLFAVLFAVLSLVPVFTVYVAAGVAAVLALLISYIFFGRLRAGVAENLAKRREAPARDDDADAEDAGLDRKPARRAAPSEED
ncbi:MULTISPECIES: DUF4229 domain-containing protein [unclassified Frondihabitans]|uniref:DUF4229 domain-containing protein n=1 Tax=unclassified Frondihabitans TaxID=2626248 RepID=UPI000FA57B8B|nr:MULTISPECIES: DUF4229 domain-containing protein [unclassified Frondihabitans]MBF4576032.1 DUF4229 domain-containing protein [Frondihabitans sp. VKM Ac-2883]RPE78874.1 uncharacterized protein DUF4229 [Frondihabitans sp. PhB153]RPF09155.1 uncharacterized protein DUF4229 [Frondihabitans sp. PhB161]